MPLSSIGEAAKKNLQQVNAVREVREVRSVVKQPLRRKWFPPAATEFKANFDGAWFNESEEAGIGVVVRDSSGQVLVALAGRKKKKKASFHGLFGDDGNEKSNDFCTRDWPTKMSLRG